MRGRHRIVIGLWAMVTAGTLAANAQTMLGQTPPVGTGSGHAAAEPGAAQPSPANASATPAACKAADASFGHARTVEIDASAGPIFGSLTRQAREPSFLKTKEVVLTFDDGPMPWVTKSILDTLDAYCAKATFFSVGRMALAYPQTAREVMARGHTLGTHTYSHPFNMPRMKYEAATGEIERGFAAVATAAGQPIAPFFRFTGLSDSSRLMGYLQTRGVAAFTVDVVSNDSYIADPAKLADRTMAEIAQTKGGIVLFHDIKTTTAKALPVILNRLKEQGYTIVHMTSKRAAEPMADALRDVAPKLARGGNGGSSGGPTLLPFYGAIGPVAMAADDVTAVAPEPRIRAADANSTTTAKTPLATDAPASTQLSSKQRPASQNALGKAASTLKTRQTASTGGPDAAAWLKQSVVEYASPHAIKDAGGKDRAGNGFKDASAAPASTGWVTNVVSKPKPAKPQR